MEKVSEEVATARDVLRVLNERHTADNEMRFLDLLSITKSEFNLNTSFYMSSGKQTGNADS
jgi:hypothetical protein